MRLIFEKFIFENVMDAISFPFWWYGRGLREISLRIAHIIERANRSLGVSLWIKNIFTPMFAQRDWQGKLISFFMRVVQIIFRGTVFLIIMVFLALLLLVWILILPAALFLIFYSVANF